MTASRSEARNTGTSRSNIVYVWTWLPGATAPVVAGGVRWTEGGVPEFAYIDSYLANPNRLALSPELELVEGWVQPGSGLSIHTTFDDALPDFWGLEVLQRERPKAFTDDANEQRVLMLLSGTDRFGAIDFQVSGSDYVPRISSATLDELHRAAEIIDAGERLTPSLDAALLHGTSIGGARPKAILTGPDGRLWIAKFASRDDRGLAVVNLEAACLDLAGRAGITAAQASVTRSLGKDVLIVERFDRDRHGHRFHTVSALAMLGFDAMAGRYVTYPEILDRLVERGAAPETGAELFDRIVMNVAIGNSDDHARNHAAFWNGTTLNLTPAYDLAPNHRSGETATQALGINRAGERESNFALCVDSAEIYGLSKAEAREAVDRITSTVRDGWADAADRARMTATQRDDAFGRQVLNRSAFYGYEASIIQVPKGGFWPRRELTPRMGGRRRATEVPVAGHCNALINDGRFCANQPGCRLAGHS